MPKRKRTKYQIMKDKAWSEFSKFIRLRDSDWRGNCTCVTCGTVKHYKDMQAGHFIPGRNNAVLFEEEHVHAQCYGCNIGKNGNPRKYDQYMRKTYGDRKVEEMDRSSERTVKFTLDELTNKYEYYKEKNKEREAS